MLGEEVLDDRESLSNAVTIGIFIVLFPFYLWKSGLPQVSTFFMALALVRAVVSGQVSPTNGRGAIKLLSLFVAYACIVNLAWTPAAILSDYGHAPPFIYAIFYVFNLAVFSYASVTFRQLRRRDIRALAFLTLTSVAIQVAASVFVADKSETRQAIFFNNPNQLGYYALICGTILAVLAKKEKSVFWISVLGVFLTLYLSAISLSKAAMLGTAGLLVIFSFAKPKKVLPLILLAIFLAGPRLSQTSVVEKAESRLNDLGQANDDNASGRGYDRLWLYPEHLVLGAGEGGYDRFPLTFPGEIHSSFGTVLFSYGLPGLALFSAFLASICLASGWIGTVFVLPSLAYGVTHMGLRFVIFWILLALLSEYARVGKRRPRANIVYRLTRRKK